MGLGAIQPSRHLAPYVSAIWDYEDLLRDSGSARLTPWSLNVFRRLIVRDCAERRVAC